MLRQSTINRNSPTTRYRRNHHSRSFHRGNNSSYCLPPIAAARQISVEKQQWSKLIGLNEQKFMAKDIGYRDDEEEVASRKIPPPSQFFSNPVFNLPTCSDTDELVGELTARPSGPAASDLLTTWLGSTSSNQAWYKVRGSSSFICNLFVASLM